MPITLRDYQFDTLEAIDAQWERGIHSTLAELFTSAGKTVIFVEYVKRKIDLTRQRILVMTPAHIILQTKVKFMGFYSEFGGYVDTDKTKRVPALGIEMADLAENKARTIIGSVETLIDRVPTDYKPITKDDLYMDAHGGVHKTKESERKVLISRRVDAILEHGMIDQIIFDEAHHAVAPGGFLIITRMWEICKALGLPLTKLIGFTATAFRDDGLALSNLFQTICIRRSQKWAEQHGYTAPLKDPIRVHARIPLGREEVLNTNNWEDLIVRAWTEKGENRQTIAYLPSVDASRQLATKFREYGIPAGHIADSVTIDIDGSVHNKEYRETLYNDFISGKCRIICNYGVILEGTDLPPASCMIWARPTDNVVMTTQAIGRIIRLFDGNAALPPKEDALIIDVTAGDLTVLTAGTLAGFRIDPLTGLYIKDDEEIEVEEKLVDGKDLRDAEKGVITSSGVIYSIGKLIRKSGSDWYHDERFDVLSLSISETDTLVIVPPYYTLATRLGQVADTLEKQLEQNYSQSVFADYENVLQALSLFENYTLWHVKRSGGEKSYVHRDVSLDRLMDFTLPYINDQSNPVSSFINKSSVWKRQGMSDPQKTMLTNLTRKYNIEYDPLLTKGEASQLISHLIAFNGNVRTKIAEVFVGISKYLN